MHSGQLVKLNDEIKDKKAPELANRKGIVFHNNNARPYTSLLTCTKLLELGWEVMSHSPYSPYLVPSDFNLFRILQNFKLVKTLLTTIISNCAWQNFF